MKFPRLAEQIVQGLELSVSPVALAFLDECPANIPTYGYPVPSSCVFWVRAEREVFFAPAAAHENCPVGMLTMGFPMSPKVVSTLDEFVAKMCAVSYVGAREPERIPRISNAKKGILYGPLDLFPVGPDLVLIWANARQAMVIEETVGAVCWDSDDKAVAFGRPACAALAVAVQKGKSTLSLGCSGMRTFTAVGDEKLLISVPGAQIEPLAQRLTGVIQSNNMMLSFYRQHREQFATS